MLKCDTGLSYTNFSYSDLTVTGTDVSVTIKNTGAVHGAEVVQLYLGFPPSAGEPPQVLRGFQKLDLAPGAGATATFNLGAGVSAFSPARATIASNLCSCTDCARRTCRSGTLRATSGRQSLGSSMFLLARRAAISC